MDTKKVVSWILILVGIYEILGLLVTSVPEISLVNTLWGWILAIVLIVVGAYMLKS